MHSHNEESPRKAAIDTVRDDVSFSDAWAPLTQRYPGLEDYCGGIATVFPGTSKVESDFSV